MRVIDYETIAFQVYLQGEDCESDLECLVAEESIDVKFKVRDTDENGKDIYSVMANGSKIGTIDKTDRDMFEYNIQNATRAILNIKKIFDTDDEITYVVEAILKVPYVIVPKDIEERVKKREKGIILVIMLLLVNAVLGIIRFEWVNTTLSVIGAGVVYYWAFIKKSGKLYDYIMKAERKIIDLF